MRRISAEDGEALTGLGDLEVAGSTLLYGRGPVRVGGWAMVRLPVGDEDKGLSTEQVEGEYGLIAALISVTPRSRLGDQPRPAVTITVTPAPST